MVFINKREVSKTTKIKIYKTVFIPTQIYGSESQVHTERLKSKIIAMEMKIIRSIEGVTILDRIRNKNMKKIEGRIGNFQN